MADIYQRIANPRERVYLPELLDEVSKLKGKVEKVDLIQKYYNKNAESRKQITQFLECLAHSKVVMDLPEGKPPFTSDHGDYNLAPFTLTKALSRVKYFVPGTAEYISNALKRENLFIQTLEGLFTPDALLFIMLKDKELDKSIYPGVTIKLLLEALPDIIPQEMVYTKKQDGAGK